MLAERFTKSIHMSLSEDDIWYGCTDCVEDLQNLVLHVKSSIGSGCSGMYSRIVLAVVHPRV